MSSPAARADAARAARESDADPPRAPPRGEAIATAPFEKAFYGESVRAVAPRSYAELADLLREAEARGLTVVPAGAGSRAYLGCPPPEGALVVSLREFDKVLRYEPDDFTVGVQAGALLANLRETLARNGQEVPVDIPSRASGTAGGLVAAAQPGPRRGRYGPVRSFVIGIHGMRGGGSLYKAGGMVVKNVAGYEVMKFLAGSMGTAGPILEVNFKLRPLPAARAGRIASFASAPAAWKLARELRARNLEPAALWVLRGGIQARLPAGEGAAAGPALSDGAGASVVWAFEGNPSAVAWQMEEAERLLAAGPAETAARLDAPGVQALLDLLGEAASPGESPPGDLGIARLAALPSDAERLEDAVAGAIGEGGGAEVATDALAGLATARWGGGAETLDRPLAALAAIARDLRGSGVLVYLPPALKRAHGHFLLPAPNRDLSLAILRAFDPQGVFFAGRLLGPGTRQEPSGS